MKIFRSSAALLSLVSVLIVGITSTAFGANVSAGTVTAWGYNGLGCLGDGTTTSSSKPVIVGLPQGVSASAIAAGEFHNLAITNDGVYTWGGRVATPAKVDFPPTVSVVTAIAASASHSMAITNDGVYAWGGNSSGQLGDGTTSDSSVPVKVLFPVTVTAVHAIAAGSYHSMAITNDGVYTWGSNGGGQLGDGTRTNRTMPVRVELPAAVTSVSAIAGGGFHSLALTNNGVYAWGNNTFGQLGDGTITTSLVPVKVIYEKKTAPAAVTAIAAGFWHSLGIGDGNIYGWGYGGNGELGSNSSSTNNVFPIKAVLPKKSGPVSFVTVGAGDLHSLALSATGEVYAFGNNSSGQLGMSGGNRYTPTKVPSEGNAIDISVGYYHSLALH